ncbi:MAG: glycine oxidase [Flavobacteriales bacterium]|jgi:glycine oxidase
MIDYLIVGQGIAGSFLSATCDKQKLSFRVISNDIPGASHVAAGLFNPVVLKRFKKVFNADKSLKHLLLLLNYVENCLDSKIQLNQQIIRKLNSVEEQNQWVENSDKLTLREYLGEIITDSVGSIESKYGYGLVHCAGRIDVQLFISKWHQYLEEKNNLISEEFDFNNLKVTPTFIEYRGIQYKNLIFCEGTKSLNNPYFSEIPIIPNKGEYIKIKTENLPQYIINSRHFIIPNSETEALIGATYQPRDKNIEPTDKAKNELLQFWATQSNAKATVIHQYAGLRPTVNDRRPIVGTHREHSTLHLLNGLGSRGLLHAPWLSYQLLNFIESGTPLHPECDIKRFYQ